MANDLCDQVDRNLQHHQSLIGLDQFLQDTPNDRYSTDSIFLEDESLALPPRLSTMLKDHHHPPTLGLFPEIHQVWLATGQRIYFYDYNKKSVFTYEAKDTVYQVGLVKAKPGITEPWVLVVNTASMITVTGLRTDPLALSSSSHGVRSGGLHMGSIVGTHNGRVLMVGKDDGHIYELDYSRGQDRLVCHTDQSLQSYLWFLPIQLKSTLDVKTKSVTVDHERKVVVALSEKSTLQIYCLDDGHLTFTAGASLSSIHDEFVSYLLTPSLQDPTKMPAPSTLAILGSTLAPRPFDLVSVHPISRKSTGSTSLIFYAVTSHGCRLYFKADTSIITRQTAFSLHHVRLPPPSNPSSSVVTQSFQPSGGIFTATFAQGGSWMTSYQEQAHGIEETTQMIDTEVIALGQQQQQSPNPAGNGDYYERIQTFFTLPQTKYVALTKKGSLCVYRKQRPVDLIADALQKGDTGLEEWKGRYGVVSTYAMVLDVLSCRLPAPPTWPQLTDDANTALVLLYSHYVKDVWYEKDLFRTDRWAACKEGLERLYTLVNTHPGFQPTLPLLSTSIQVISLITFLIQLPGFDRQGHMEKKTFKDLVTTTTGHNSLAHLVTEAIRQTASHTSTPMITSYLVKHCPTLLPWPKYEADEYLSRAEHTHLPDNLAKALEKYLASPDLTDDARRTVCTRFQAMDYATGVITLTLANGDDFAPILALLTMNDDHRISTVLPLILDDHPNHTALHCAIYTWLIDHDKMQILYETYTDRDMTTRHTLTPFLEKDGAPERLDWLYRYYDHQHDREASAGVLTRLATETRNISLDRRIAYLRLALDRSPPSPSLQHLYDVALVQQEIAAQLPSEERDDRLVSRLVGVDDLLTDYAVAFFLWPQVLLLLATMPRVDDVLMYKAWTGVIQDEKDLDALADRFVALGHKLYPSIALFSIYLLVRMMEARVKDERKPGFVVDLFVKIGVPPSLLLDAYEYFVIEKPEFETQIDYITSLSF